MRLIRSKKKIEKFINLASAYANTELNCNIKLVKWTLTGVILELINESGECENKIELIVKDMPHHLDYVIKFNKTTYAAIHVPAHLAVLMGC